MGLTVLELEVANPSAPDVAEKTDFSRRSFCFSGRPRSL